MIFLYVILLLVAAEIIYMMLAKRFNLIEIKDEEIGAKARRPLKGSGIVFWVAALLYAIFNPVELSWWFWGITLVAIVGFWDDTQSAGTWIRLILHCSATILSYDWDFGEITWWNMAVVYVVFIGILAFKFMDGVHGMTGLYAIGVISHVIYQSIPGAVRGRGFLACLSCCQRILSF